MESDECALGGSAADNYAADPLLSGDYRMDEAYDYDLLKRMEDKGAVFYEAGERAKLYYPKIGRNEAALQETEEFLERVFDGRMGLMLNTMVEQKALSETEIAELYEILGRAEAQSRREAGMAERTARGKDGEKL